MKELLLQYARYNAWANKKMIDALLKLDEGAMDIEMVSSFPSIRTTVYHSWSAESIWLDRLNGVEQPIWHQGTFTGAFDAACHNWARTSITIHDLVREWDEEMLLKLISFVDRRGSASTIPAFQILHHAFNHATYHRGQLVTMLRQAGATEIPGTDFVGFLKTEY